MNRCLAILCLGAMLTAPVGADAGEKELKIQNSEALNTPADEVDPCPVDATTFLYVSNTNGTFDIMSSRRTLTARPFPAGKLHPISLKSADERSPFMFKGTMFFATNEVPDEKLKDLKNFDIVRKPESLAQFPIVSDVSSKADEMYPLITPAGKEFYFSRKTKEGWMQMVAMGPTPGPIANGKELGFPVGFHKVTLMPNALDMFLEGPLENGRVGIFRSKRAKVGQDWSTPQEVTALNHAESKKGDMMPALTSDGTRLYFVSDRPGGKGGLDIWSVPVSQLPK